MATSDNPTTGPLPSAEATTSLPATSVPGADPTSARSPSASPGPTTSASDPPTRSPDADASRTTSPRPTVAPSSSPSTEGTIISYQTLATQLEVGKQRKLDENERHFFMRTMESHTDKIGLNLTKPFIRTECVILQQALSRRRNGTSIETGEQYFYHWLTVYYSMNYTSIYGYGEIQQYPAYFRDYMHSNVGLIENLHIIIADLPDPHMLLSLGNTVFFNASLIVPDVPTAVPTPAPIIATSEPTAPRDTGSPSEMPSLMPSVYPIPPMIISVGPGRAEVYLIAILACATIASVVAVVFFLLFRRSRSGRGEGGTSAADDDGGENKVWLASSDGGGGGVEGSAEAAPVVRTNATETAAPGEAGTIAVRSDRSEYTGETRETASSSAPRSSGGAESNDRGRPSVLDSEMDGGGSNRNATGGGGPSLFDSTMAQTGLFYPTMGSTLSAGPSASRLHSVVELSENEDSVRRGSFAGSNPSAGTFPGGPNLMENRSESLSSSESFDGTISSRQLPRGDDEFDDYRDNLLEDLRAEVERTIDGVDGMMSMAISRTYMDPGTAPDASWFGGDDLGSIEASSLRQAFEWKRKDHLSASLFSSTPGRGFFDDLLDKIVFIVHRGLIRPRDGARILHACASVVGVPLLRELPGDTVTVKGLVRTNDLALGHHLLVEAFSPFGDIVDASIAPQNKGFGFVRFVQPKSVEAVLKKHRELEIEIQRVAVSIKAL